ncbi:MAG: DUF3084 domain-containing protein [Synergistaceae bacterium]|nr:DUF3084 domain-containing protein [Synergistaceae bacterium]
MQSWIYDTNWWLIFFLIIGSGLLSWFGDVIGMKFGKRRVSLFGLRPKDTSHVITAFTGVMITALTVVVLASFSEDVRTTLFSLKYIQNQLNESRVNLMQSKSEAENALIELENSRYNLAQQETALEKSKAEVDLLNLSLSTLRNDKQLLEDEKTQLEYSVESLRNEAQELRINLERIREGTIVIRVHEVLAQDVVQPNASSADVAAIIDDMRRQAAENIAEKFGTLPENVAVTINSNALENVVEASSNSDIRRYIRLSAEHNITSGSSVSLTCDSWVSYLIYNEGEPILRRVAEPNLEGFDPQQFMHAFLRELRFKAVRDGISPDPVTNYVGSLDGQKFYEAVEKLAEMNFPVIVNGITTKDIYTEGPVSLRILIEE